MKDENPNKKFKEDNNSTKLGIYSGVRVHDSQEKHLLAKIRAYYLQKYGVNHYISDNDLEKKVRTTYENLKESGELHLLNAINIDEEFIHIEEV